ncbi:MAG: HD domain-containing protein [Microbacter sp.]
MQTKKRKIINDPVFGFISIPTETLYDIIQHPYMQRLTRIKQLGLSSFVYPGTQHTRFQHSLGAMYLMGEAIRQLRWMGADIRADEEEAALAAILMHDIGHAPFSHVLENSLVSGISHEEISTLMMEEIRREMDACLPMAISIFKGTYPKYFLHQLISGQLDMDRLDYLRRDSFYAGVTEGSIGSAQIIRMLDLHEGRLVIQEKGVYSIEKFLLARRLMYWQVYLHKTSIAAEQLLIHILMRAKELALGGHPLFGSPSLQFFLNQPIQKEDFYRSPEVLRHYAGLDDSDIVSAIKVWMSDADTVLATLSDAFINRRLFKINVLNRTMTDKEVDEMEHRYMDFFQISAHEAHYFWAEEKVSNETYAPDEEGIKIKFKNGELKDITESSDMFNLDVLTKEASKLYLCYLPLNHYVGNASHKNNNP